MMPLSSANKNGSCGGQNKSPTLPERVAQLYYTHGLFCSSYPTTVITIALTIALACCYPLLNLPLPGNFPQQISWPANESITNASQSDFPYIWAKAPPFCYVQQILVRSAVIPWSDELVLTDAFRGPIYEVFRVLEIIRNHQDEQTSKTLGHICLHVENIKRKTNNPKVVMPEYNCLVLSPANLWQHNVNQFNAETNILSTIFSYQNLQKGKVSLSEMLFGMHLKDTGIKRYPIRNRQRVVQYAITIFLTEIDESFISSLRAKLQRFYPLHQNVPLNLNQSEITKSHNDILYIYYPGEFNYVEFIPLSIAFVALFWYIYFSVRKIELVKSKFGMAFAAVATVVLSLSMSIGLCFFFGLTLSMQGKEVFPYLVILVGLENVLVLTKSVVTTPLHLDVKIRVAQGLSKEGWSITKNILIEITILTIGLFTFIPAIQEFCIFAIVGLISDFFLQMLFFSTFLALDIKRMELLTSSQMHNYKHTSLYTNQTNHYDKVYPPRSGLNRSKSHPRLSGSHTDVVASQAHGASERKIPKRLRLVSIWARTRIFQRGFMIWMVVWISMIVYDSGIIEQILEATKSYRNDTVSAETYNSDSAIKSNLFYPTQVETTVSTAQYKNAESFDESHMRNVLQPDLSLHPSFVNAKLSSVNHTDDLLKLKHSDFSPVLRLNPYHWSAIFRLYNLSLGGNYISVLPSIRISHVVTPDQAIQLRNNEEKSIKHFQWQALAAALDPLDFNDGESVQGSSFAHMTPYYPTSPMEIMLTTILCVISVIVLAYAFVVLYRCVCTRNYAEWRASWSNEKNEEPVTQLVMEAVASVLEGHPQQVECVASDDVHIVSSCLAGQLRIWDPLTAETLAVIDRKTYFGPQTIKTSPDHTSEFDENTLSDYESGSPPSRDENTLSNYAKLSLPTLQQKINTNFSNLKLETTHNVQLVSKKTSFDFGPPYRQFFLGNNDLDSNLCNQKNSETACWVFNDNERNTNCLKQRCYSVNSSDSVVCGDMVNVKSTHRNDFSNGTVTGNSQKCVPPVWCMDYVDNLIAVGCANGRLEFWEGTTGKFKCLFEDGTGVGITSLKLVANRVIAAKLNGMLDFFLLESYTHGRQMDWGFTSAYRRTHVRTGSAGSIADCRDYVDAQIGNAEDIRCILLKTTRAHQQPITVLDSEGGRVLTGSQDHTLKVFRLEDQAALYTLHGHCGPITCLFIDRMSPMMSGSGSQDGLLCVWDLMTGACMYSIQAHDGSIISLTYSASYVISLGSDDRMCVWERFQGHLLNTIQVSQTYATSVVMLTQCLVVTARQGSLIVWDVRSGEEVRRVPLGHQDSYTFVKLVLPLPGAHAVVCDYSNQLRIVRFPLVHQKNE